MSSSVRDTGWRLPGATPRPGSVTSSLGPLQLGLQRARPRRAAAASASSASSSAFTWLATSPSGAPLVGRQLAHAAQDRRTARPSCRGTSPAAPRRAAASGATAISRRAAPPAPSSRSCMAPSRSGVEQTKKGRPWGQPVECGSPGALEACPAGGRCSGRLRDLRDGRKTLRDPRRRGRPGPCGPARSSPWSGRRSACE